MRHGPHHSAQKSTRTGASALSTVESKLPSVKVCTCSDAMSVLLPVSMAPAPAPVGGPRRYLDSLLNIFQSSSPTRRPPWPAGPAESAACRKAPAGPGDRRLVDLDVGRGRAR